MKLHIPDEALAQHMGVLGKTGSGKTSTAKLLVEQVVDAGARVCILDPIKSDWWGLTSSADGQRPGLPFSILGGPRGHVPLHAAAGKAIGEVVATGALPLSILDMADFNPGGQAQFFVDFAPTLLRKMRGVLYLVIEEAHLFAPKERSGIGAETHMIHWAKTLATAGRSKGIRLVLITQRTQALHNALLGSCDTLIAHRFTAPADQEPIIKWLKANVSPEITKQVAGSLSSLKTGEAWFCSGEARIFERRSFPRIATYDNSATPTADSVAHEVKTAAVDLEGLRDIVGEAVKEAEANDPKALRRTIADLQAQLKTAGAAAGAAQVYANRPTNDVQALEAARADGYEDGRINGFQAGVKASMVPFVGILPELQDALSEMGLASVRIRALRDRIEAAPIPDPGASPGQRQPSAAPARLQSHGNGAARPAQPQASPASATRASGVTAPQQRILDELAALEALGIAQPNKTQLALWCEVSPTSGGYFNNLGTLRSAGLIEYPAAGEVALTDAGRSAAQAREPLTVDQMQDALCARVGNARAAILRALIRVYPRDLPKDDLAKRIEVSPTSGGYFNNLGALRSLGVIDYPAPGRVAALPVLFLVQ